MGKQEGADAHGPRGSRTGDKDGWHPKTEADRQSADHNNAKFDEAQARRDAQRNQGRDGK